MEINRLFHLAYQEPLKGSEGEILKAGFHYLTMDSIIHGEYGIIRCRCIAQIESPFDFKCFFIETSGESQDNLFSYRSACINYFNINILPLFNPLSHLDYGLSQTSQNESENSE